MNWKEVVDELPSAVVIVNQRGEVIYVNKILGERSGLTDEEMMKNPHKYFPPDDYSKLSQWVIETFIKQRKNPDPALLIRSFDAYGHQTWIEARTRFAKIEGEPYCLIVYTDVSERVELQKRIENLNEYLKFLNSTLRHDILNIFTRAYSFLELYEENQKIEFIEKLKSSLESGIELVKKMKELESTMEVIREPYRLRDVIEKIACSYGVRAVIEGDAVVLANEGIHIIFSNLIGNAIKHGKATEVKAEISYDGEENVKVIFENNGKGIPPEFSDKLFKKGFTTGGTGLGLYIVKNLITSLGGSIKLIDPSKSAFLLTFKAGKK